MLHVPVGPALRRRVLPVLLVGACTAAFGGLVAVAPTAGDSPVEADVVAYADTRPAPVLAPVDRERTAARASRGRRIAEAEAARVAAEAAAAQAAAEAAAAAAAAEAAARAQAEAEAAAQAKAKAEAEEKAKAEAAAQAQAAASMAGSSSSARSGGGGACPVPGASFTNTYGAPRSGGRSHQGTDLLAPYGSPVYAVVSGRVRTASSSLGGVSLYLEGDNGETYFYAHNSANVASTGQRVGAGDLVARVGSTGNAGGTNHVHFERQVGGRSVNPYDFLRRLC